MNRVQDHHLPRPNSSVTFHYDYRGRRDSVTDQNGNKTTYAMTTPTPHLHHRPTNSNPGVTQYSYDNENNLKTLPTPTTTRPF